MSEKKPKPRASSSVNVSLRLDPKTKYLIDLLAREQKRTITGVVEWALERAAENERFDLSRGYDGPSFRDMIDELWSTDEAMRLIALALNKASLLDYEEMRIWETIKASPDLWLLPSMGQPVSLKKEFIDCPMLQEHWEQLLEHVQKHRHARSIKAFSLVEQGVSKEEIDGRKITNPNNPHLDFDDEIPY
ncbi:hypothetical protein Q8G38_15935 [Halomonas venusta]|uniref:hypothetical protein n=1 Tax=Pseudomonadota TaxID=1224 RepID=UPI00295EE3FC|nr:hypothetical protein [Halomonas venusta]MDW0360803.1 hypothetical protein [Halomonas venusta]